VVAQTAYLFFFTFIPLDLALRLAALALSLASALVAPSTGPGSRLVAFGEDYISSQKPSVGTSRDAPGSDLALLDGCASSSCFRISD
jgi:hypothetical protein